MRYLVGLYARVRNGEVLSISEDEPTASPGIQVGRITDMGHSSGGTWVLATTRIGRIMAAKVPEELA